MLHSPRHRLVGLLLFLAAPCLAQLGALEEASKSVDIDDLDPFEDEIVVIEVEVPVRVFVDDEPVRGLEKDDFQIWERGERRPIIAFEAIDLSRAEPLADSGAAQGAQGAKSSAAQAEPAKRHFLALFDLTRGFPPYLARSVESVRRMTIEQLHPADRMGLAIMNVDGAQLLLGFTKDRDRIGIALDLVQATLDRDKKAYSEARRKILSDQELTLTELADSMGAPAALALGGPIAVLDVPAPSAPELDLSMVDFMERDARYSGGTLEAFQIGSVLESGARLSGTRRRFRSLERLITVLRGVSGQRYLLNFSGETTDFFFEAQGGDMRTRSNSMTGSGTLAAYNDLVAEFRRSGWVIQSFNVGGVPSAPGVTSDRPSTASPTSMMSAGSLFFLANETGGQLYENFNHIHVATRAMVERTSVSYRLIFQAPDLRRNGRYQDLDVRLEPGPRVPPGARVVARKGYYAPKPSDELSEIERRMRQADELFYGSEVQDLSGDLFTTVVPMPDGRRRLVMLASADLGPLLEQRPQPRKLEAELHALALCAARSGQPRQFAGLLRQSIEADWRANKDVLRRGFEFVGDLILPPRSEGDCVVRVRLRDRRTGLRWLAVSDRGLGPASKPGAAERALASFFVRPKERRSERGLVVRESDATAVESPNSPFVIRGRAVLPWQSPELPADQPVALLFRLYAQDLPEVVSFRFRVIREQTGEQLPAPLVVRESIESDDGQLYLASLDLAQVAGVTWAPGDYTLRLEWIADDQLGVETLISDLPFRVVQ